MIGDSFSNLQMDKLFNRLIVSALLHISDKDVPSAPAATQLCLSVGDWPTRLWLKLF